MPAENDLLAENDLPAESELPAESDLSAESDLPTESDLPAEEEPAVPELTEEEKLERAKALIAQHEREYRQRIEDAKARIRTRGVYQRARREGRIYMHTVQPGETMADIARIYYAKSERWEEIYEANKDRIPDSGEPPPGMELRIP
jgi:nucleoid-associated protein YgaU